MCSSQPCLQFKQEINREQVIHMFFRRELDKLYFQNVLCYDLRFLSALIQITPFSDRQVCHRDLTVIRVQTSCTHMQPCGYIYIRTEKRYSFRSWTKVTCADCYRSGKKTTLYFSHRFLKCLGCVVHLAVGNPTICINTDCIHIKVF